MNNTINKTNLKNQPRSIVMPKSKSSNGIIKIIVGIALLGVVAVALSFYFNFGGVRDIFSMSQLAKETVENDIRQELDNQKMQNDEERKNLMALKAELNKKESLLNEKEIEIEELMQDVEYLKEQLESKVSDIQSLSKLYEKMEPAIAAGIIKEYPDKKVIVNVLKIMSSSKAAAILSELDSKSASQLIQMLSQ